MRKVFFIIFALIVAAPIWSSSALAQKPSEAKPDAQKPATNFLSSSAAYAELLLRRTELQSEIESLIIDYTEDFPKVKEDRYAMSLIDRDIARLGKTKAIESSKLTLALGKLMIRKIELETDLWNLQKNYQDGHPDVKKARRKLEIYDTAIEQILN